MEIVCLQNGNDGTPAYCLPTTAGTLESYYRLAKAIGPGHLLYGIQFADRLQSGKFMEFASLQEMAVAMIPGLLAHHDMLRFKRAGAVVTVQPEIGVTIVDWPQDTLRWFILEDVVLHELGHHVLQHYKAKRSARVARTKDHEAFAARFAARQREALRKLRNQNS